jgi:hypothetical protein
MLDLRRSTLDERGGRVLDLAVPALLSHPDDLRRVLREAGALELVYEARHGEHVKRGVVGESGRFRMRFEPRVDPDGAWELRIASRAGRELWRQLLFVQSGLRRTQAQIAELARRHAPVFVFSSEERYFPVSLRTLLRDPLVRESAEAMQLKTVFGKERVPLRELSEFMRFNGHADYLLDFNVFSMRRSVFASLGGDPRASVVYYSYIEDPDSERFFISYHQIYAFDTKTGLARLTQIGPHVFDRESMILVFGDDERPTSMIISGHLEHQTIFFLNKLKRWSEGRIRVPFDDERTLKLGEHPVIAVGEGSHALYPMSGEYQLSLLREIAGYLDPEVFGAQGRGRGERALQPEQILLAPTLQSRTVPTYELISLGLDQLTSRITEDPEGRDRYRAFLVFSGYWVDVPGTQNARFPPFTRNVTEIADWVDGAYEWLWDDVPDRYHDNNGLILRFLSENAEDR